MCDTVKHVFRLLSMHTYFCISVNSIRTSQVSALILSQKIYFHNLIYFSSNCVSDSHICVGLSICEDLIYWPKLAEPALSLDYRKMHVMYLYNGGLSELIYSYVWRSNYNLCNLRDISTYPVLNLHPPPPHPHTHTHTHRAHTNTTTTHTCLCDIVSKHGAHGAFIYNRNAYYVLLCMINTTVHSVWLGIETHQM